LSWVMIFLLITPFKAMPQGAGGTPPSANFTKEELDQMLAPIALYPDSLLSQILMASTYPIEVVDADRWVKQTPSLTGNQLDEALKSKNWDMSVKSLCHFPTVLSAMSQNLDETTRLGNAFLNQQQDVMDTVQELRAKAQAQGNLNTTAQQRVTAEQGYIEIEPANPEVIYVPAYNPAVVYGPWWYPDYPPYLWYPGVAFGIGVSFGFGFFVGPWIGSWCGFNWGYHNIHIHNVQGGGWQTWGHNPEHRMGVAYWNKATSQRFGQPTTTRSMAFSSQYRGYGGSFTRQNIPHGQFQQNRGGGGSLGGTRGYGGSFTRQNIPHAQFQQNRGGGVSLGGTRGGVHDSAFSGINNWNSERMAGQRGQTSHTHSFGAGGHEGGGSGGSHSSGNPKKEKGH
jgi:hypothetical protein